MISVILTDIEGTTSSIGFVHEVLFPYAAKNIDRFVRENQVDQEVADQLAVVAEVAQLPVDDVGALIAQLKQWIAEDKKVTPLKVIQGLLWREGYESGVFQGHIYDDAFDGLTAWKEQNIDLYVYSSGSVAAQRLLFGYTRHGNLNDLFSGNFDTQVGGKKEASSYASILSEIGVPSENVLFLSDIVEELEAAKAVGMKVCWLVREGELPAASNYPVVNSFSDISLSDF